MRKYRVKICFAVVDPLSEAVEAKSCYIAVKASNSTKAKIAALEKFKKKTFVFIDEFVDITEVVIMEDKIQDQVVAAADKYIELLKESK